jgi:hypothetical protein
MSRDRFRLSPELRALHEMSLDQDDTLGGLIPSIGGGAAVLPETEDFAAFGDAPGAAELAESQDVESQQAAQIRAARRLQREDEISPLFNDEGEPMVQPERGLQRQLGVRPRSDIALEEFASSPGVAAALGMGDVLLAPRAISGAVAEATGGDYDTAQADTDRLLSESPYASAAGAAAGSLPLIAAGPLLGDAAIARLGGAAALPAYARSIPALSRIGAAGIEGMLWGGGHEAVTDRRVGPEAMFSGALGAGLASVPVAVGAAARSAGSFVDSLEDSAKQWRTRAAGGRTIPVQRGLAALPGGTAGVADDLDALGISPRYSVHSVDDARQVADRVKGRAGRNIGRVFDRMARADADDVARFASELEPVQARDAQRAAAFEAIDLDDPSMLLIDNPADTPLGRVGREIYNGRVGRDGDAIMDAVRGHLGGSNTAPTVAADLDSGVRAPQPNEASSGIASPRARRRPPRPDSSRTPENLIRALEADQITDVMGASGTRPEFRGMRLPQRIEPPTPEAIARLRQMVDVNMPAIEAPRPAGVVDVDPVARALDGIAGDYSTLPSGATQRGAASSMADDYRATGGRMPFAAAQRERKLLDEAISWQPGTNPVNDRRGAIQGDLRRVRGELQGQMDDAVRRVDPELGAEYPRQRREFQIGSIFGNLGADDAMRETANRQISPTDYVAAMEGDSWLTRGRNVILNRLLRGREASLGAAGAEHLSDALQRTPDVSGAMNSVAGRTGRLAGALNRPEILDQRQPASLPGVPSVSATELERLPMLDAAETSDVPEFDPAELEDLEAGDVAGLPELTDEELRALPVIE